MLRPSSGRRAPVDGDAFPTAFHRMFAERAAP
jgi:hypothetical protein